MKRQTRSTCSDEKSSDKFSDNPNLVKRKINDEIGYGVFAVADFEADIFLCEYKGILSDETNGMKALSKAVAGSFCYFFNVNTNNYCLNATDVDGICKYVNDAKKGKANTTMIKKVDKWGFPKLCLYTKKKVKIGMEIRYDYGPDDDELIWRKEEKNLELFTLDAVGCKCREIDCLCHMVEQIYTDEEVNSRVSSKGRDNDSSVFQNNINILSENNEVDSVKMNDQNKVSVPLKEKVDDSSILSNTNVENVLENSKNPSSILLEAFEVKSLPYQFSEDDLIGEGTAAVVYRHNLKGKLVAVKKFRNKLLRGGRTLKICQTLLDISDANIVKFFGYSFRPPCFVFELCELNWDGDIVNNVQELMEIWNANDIFCFHERMKIVFQASLGLKVLHEHDIVHRDIKPSNLLVSGKPSNICVKVADFDGLHYLKTVTKMTKTSSSVTNGCTISYCANELCLRKVGSPTLNSDIYSWAMSMFEIMAGIPHPWFGKLDTLSDLVLLKALENSERPSIDLLHNHYVREDINKFENLIVKAWDSDMMFRPSIHEIVTFLQSNYNMEPVIISNHTVDDNQSRTRETPVPIHNLSKASDAHMEPVRISSHNVDDNRSRTRETPIIHNLSKTTSDAHVIQLSNASDHVNEAADQMEPVRVSSHTVDDNPSRTRETPIIQNLSKTTSDTHIIQLSNVSDHVNEAVDQADSFRVLADTAVKSHVRTDDLSLVQSSSVTTVRKDAYDTGTKRKIVSSDEDPFVFNEDEESDKETKVKCSSPAHLKKYGLRKRPLRLDIPMDNDTSIVDEWESHDSGIQKSLYQSEEETSSESEASDGSDSDFQPDMDFDPEISFAEEEEQLSKAFRKVEKAERIASCSLEKNNHVPSIENNIPTQSHEEKDTLSEEVNSDSNDIDLEIRSSNAKDNVVCAEESEKESDSDENVDDDREETVNDNNDTIKRTGKASKSRRKEITESDLKLRDKSGHKYHICFFCGVKEIRMPRHMENLHYKEDEVVDALKFEKDSPERNNAWALLERKGDYMYNIEALKKGGPLIVLRQGKHDSEYLPCIHCLGFVCSRKLSSHVATCFNKDKDAPHDHDVVKAARLRVSNEINPTSSTALHNYVLNKMKNRDLSLLIRNDKMLMKYGTLELNKRQKARYHDVSYALRILARLILVCRETKSDFGSEDLILPENYDLVVEAMKSMSGYEGPREINNPHLVLRIGYSLKSLAIICKLEYLKITSQMMVEKIRSFIELYEGDFVMLANNARCVYEMKRGNAPEELPTENDIKLLRDFCVQEIKKVLKVNKLTITEYSYLNKLTYTRVLTFNARRGGEPGKLTLDDWKMVEDGKWKYRTDTKSINDPVERTLAERMKLCYVEGKKKHPWSKEKRLVPVLFTEEVVDAIRVLISNRRIAHIPLTNKSIFAVGTGDNVLRGWDTLDSIKKKLCLEKPELITPTRTRKYIATVLQLLDVTNSELEWLTNHMGHTEKVHRNWYRKEDATIELTKVARVFVAIDSANSKSMQNKKIDALMKESNREVCQSERNVESLDEEDDEFFEARPGPSRKSNEYVEPVRNSARSSGESPKSSSDPASTDESAGLLKVRCNFKKKQSKPRNQKGQPIGNDEEEIPTKKQKKSWKPWHDEEVSLLKTLFKEYLDRKLPCPLKEVSRIISNCDNEILKNRGDKVVKYKLNNMIRS